MTQTVRGAIDPKTVAADGRDVQTGWFFPLKAGFLNP